MTSILKFTLAQSRDRAQAQIGTVGIPNKWWPYDYGEDCLGYVLWCLGVRSRSQTELKYISIKEFLDVFVDETFVPAGRWQRIPAAQIRPGDIAVENWSGTKVPEHVELSYSVLGTSLTTDAADTGPAPGVEEPRGAWHKTRTIGPWLLFAIRPPYKPAASTVTAAQRARVRLEATWLNQNLPDDCQPSAAGDIGNVPGDGIPGPVFWRNVQTWGNVQGIYPTPPYVIDGIPGDHTTGVVEPAIYARAKAAGKG